MKNKSIINRLNSIFPELGTKGVKGTNGRIGVIGGSYQFTGAPFYSAISALKAGGDLAHIFCSKASSVSIKSYSPQIIVHPVFQSEEQIRYSKYQIPKIHQVWIEKIRSWQKAISSWVIGPGLGRDKYMQQFFPILVKNISKDKIIIFDADGIYYLAQNPQLFQHLKSCKTIITPNHRQLGFLKPYLKIDLDKELGYTKNQDEIQELPDKYRKIHDFTLIVKGAQDLILGPQSYVVRTKGGFKRCGGIGDILAGVTSVYSLWDFELGPVLASRIVKLASKKAFNKEGRSLTAPSIIKELPYAIKEIQQKF